ncbi:MAG: hypothetical protein ACXQTS_06310 [Candidatus Methanospirareceae archaeon]
MAPEKKKIKLKIKGKEEGATPTAAPSPVAPAVMPSVTPSKMTPPKITLKGLKIRIDEINLARKR